MSSSGAGATRRRARAREDRRLPYFAAALELLDEKGYAGLQLRPLCQHLGVTTGAFYYAFEDWRDFTHQFLAFWHDDHTTRLVAGTLAEPDPRSRLRHLLDIATNLPHRAEAAIRVWSAIDPEVEAIQKHVDDERQAVLRGVLEDLIGGDAEIYTRWGMMQLIGFEQSLDRDPDLLRWSLDEVFRAALEHRSS